VAIYFTFRALTIREPERESALEFQGDDGGESPGPNPSEGSRTSSVSPSPAP
jgi:hypothetical protein